MKGVLKDLDHGVNKYGEFGISLPEKNEEKSKETKIIIMYWSEMKRN